MTIKSYSILLIFFAGLFVFAGCEKEEFYERTRLFRPVLNEELMAEGNTIIVDMGNIREAVSYTLEISRDSFQTIDYTIETDTSYVVIDAALLNGEELFWNTLYQVRATAHSADPAFDSRVSDLGQVRTERFPSILNIPGEGDIIDRAVRVTWTVAGAPVSMIRIFGPDDLRLRNPLEEREVSSEEQTAGLAIVSGLDPLTAYQVAIYSGSGGDQLRGWEAFTTLPAGVDATDPNVIDLSNDEDPDAVINAVATAADGNVILLKKGVIYNLPDESLDKSITIVGAQDFGAQKAVLFTDGNWNIKGGVMIDHIRFIDVELRGEDYGGDYVFNPNRDDLTTIRELTFDNCVINNFRGIIRIRGMVFLQNYTITNSFVHHLGGYGIITADSGGEGEAAVDHILLENSTFSKLQAMMTSRQNAQSITIEGCTFSEFASPNGIVFRWRGDDGVRSNVIGGITISDSIFGHAWVEGDGDNFSVRGIYDGLEATNFNITNTYATSDFSFTEGSEIPGFPSLQYSGSAQDLWVSPYEQMDFHFQDSGFSGKFDTGDPRWRAKL